MGLKKSDHPEVAVSTVEAARSLAGRLVEFEMNGGNDREGALRRVEAKYGINYWTLWHLLYRRPKSIAAEKAARLRHAYLDRCEAEIRKLQHELEIERKKGVLDDASIADIDHSIAASARKLAEAKAKA